MSTCFTTVELHPQGPADVAALARAEAHAERCEPCAERLAELRSTDALLTNGLARFAANSACPEPEALAAWIDAGRPADAAELLQHLSTCADCRADLLDVLEDDDVEAAQPAATRRPSSRRSQRLASPRRTRVLEVAVAAGVAGLAITWWASSQPTSKDPKLVASRPAPRVTEAAPTPLKIPAAPRPRVTAAPKPVTTTAPSPRPAPTAVETRRPAPAPVPTRSARPTPAPAPTAAPSTPRPTPTPADPTPLPSASPTAAPPAAVASLPVSESAGLALKDQRGKLQVFKGNSISVGAELYASSRGGRLLTPQGLWILAPRTRMTYTGALYLNNGKAVVEGRDLVVHHGLAKVRVQGRVLLEARKNKLGVSVLVGSARVQRDGHEPAELSRGGWWAGAKKKPSRTGQVAVKPGRPTQLPGWARPLHPNPTGGLRGRPGRRGPPRGPKTGGPPRGGPKTGGPPRGGPKTGGPRPPRGPRQQQPGGRPRPPSR